MRCEEFTERLDDYLAGRLDAELRAAALRHVNACEECRELAALLGEKIELPAMPASDELTRAILARTSGSACERSVELLSAGADENLDPIDRELLQGHRQVCEQCNAMALAMQLLSADLPTMAAITPDPNFAVEVAAATSGRPGYLDRGVAAASRWVAVWRRPRLALEVGYLAAMVLWLVVSLGGDPLRQAPSRAIEAARTHPVRVAGLTEPIRAFSIEAISYGEIAWEATGGRGIDAARTGAGALAESYRATAAPRGQMKRHGRELWDASLRLDLHASTDAIQDLAGDAASIWHRLRQNDEE